MKILDVAAFNFSSYRTLEFNPKDAGLALIYGPTGSGKSTLLDAACWALFGVTSKNGSVDEVRSWQHPEEHTVVLATVELPDGKTLDVERRRGMSKENDLYWREDDSNKIRGKDLKDTQRLLEERLGVTADLYLSAAYASEFNPTATFFVANAKTRRAVFENIASLNFAATLESKSSALSKLFNKDLDKLATDIDATLMAVDSVTRQISRLKDMTATWNVVVASSLKSLQDKLASFDADKAQRIKDAEERSVKWENNRTFEIATIKDTLSKIPTEDICSRCGQYNKDYYNLTSKLKVLEESKNHISPTLPKLMAEVNHYAAQVDEVKSRTNPYLSGIQELDTELTELRSILQEREQREEELKNSSTTIATLTDLCSDLRVALLQNSVNRVQTDTNDYLERFFDSEFRVSFTLDGSDALEVEIMKSGYPCVYRQLSKGQRQILKLCFTVAVMKASANRAGIHFDNLYFDEPTDGCDAEFKVKSFKLFEELALSHSSVLVVDHSTEFKELFTNRYKVSLVNDVSVIESDNE